MDTPEIQGASDSILRRRRLTELPVISPDAPLEMFDGEDRDVLVQGDLAFLHVVRSEGSVLIQGSIRGSAAQPAYILSVCLYWQYAGNWPRRYGSVRK